MKAHVQQLILVFTLASSVFLSSLGTSMANIALPIIASDLETTFAKARLIILAYLVANTLFNLIVGYLGDRYGHLRILGAGIGLFVLGSFICSLSPSLTVLILARVIQGVGASALIVLPLTIISNITAGGKTGSRIGILATMSALGTAFGPSVGGLLLSISSWRSTFSVMAILGILIFLLTRQFGPKSVQVPPAQSKLLLSDLRSFALGSSIGIQLVSNYLVSTVMMTTLIVGPYFLKNNFHLDPSDMGLVMSVGPITSIFSGVLSGLLVDRIGARRVFKFGLFQMLLGALSFIIAPLFLGVFGFALSAMFLSVGYQLFLSSNSSAVMMGAHKNAQGRVSGALSLSRNLGLISGTLMMGSVYDLFVKFNAAAFVSVSTDMFGFQGTFSFAAILILVLIRINSKQRRSYESKLT